MKSTALHHAVVHHPAMHALVQLTEGPGFRSQFRPFIVDLLWNIVIPVVGYLKKSSLSKPCFFQWITVYGKFSLNHPLDIIKTSLIMVCFKNPLRLKKNPNI